jgi:hypothetical protein
MTFTAHRARMVDHYAELASKEGWKKYVWVRVNQMAEEFPDLYQSLPKLVTERVKESQSD